MNTENNVENAAVETAETTTATAPAERPERTFAPKNNPRRRRKVCPFCADKIDYIDYKDALRLRKVRLRESEDSPPPRIRLLR